MITLDSNKPPVIAVSSGLGESGEKGGEGGGREKEILPKKTLKSMSLPMGFNLAWEQAHVGAQASAA